jgi:hypothetical protein
LRILLSSPAVLGQSITRGSTDQKPELTAGVPRFLPACSWCRSSLSNCSITTVQDGNASRSWSGRARQENLGKARIRSRRLARILSGGNDEVVDPVSGALHALNRDAAAMSIAEEKAAGFRAS